MTHIKLTFIGSGSAFTVGQNNYQSNILISCNNQQLLIDCGSDARLALHELGYSHEDIDNLFISHLHCDHIGGLEWLALMRYFDSKKDKPKLFISKNLINDLWNKCLSGGLSTLKEQQSCLNTFFDIQPLDDNSAFKWQNINFQLIKTEHYYNNNQIMPCFGLFITTKDHKIFFSGDTRFTPQLLASYYNKADIILQDCEVAKERSKVHANYEQLKTLNKTIKQKMWLYHFDSTMLLNSQNDNFLGFIKKGQVFEFKDN